MDLTPQNYALNHALGLASDTKGLVISSGAIQNTAALFTQHFGAGQPAAIIADRTTFGVAGPQVIASFKAAGLPVMVAPWVFEDTELHAEYRHIEQLDAWLASHKAVPIAVGSGVINDLVKLAAHRAGRRYMVVPTAASMDGYTAFGASITREGSKQTFDCPAPLVVLADLDILCAAPPEMSAAGYADLAAKNTAGADWIIADALGIEPIDETAWDMVQIDLLDALDDPQGVRLGRPEAIESLIVGLMISGLAMQHTRTSRPASGAEHQFSHLWDMQHHTYKGHAPSHGFKVGIGTLAMARLYQEILELPMKYLDPDMVAGFWPDQDAVRRKIDAVFANEPELAAKAHLETEAKWISPADLLEQLQWIQSNWSILRGRLKRHLLRPDQLKMMLQLAGAPTNAAAIGISPERLRNSHEQAYYIRRRLTVLDLAMHLGVLDISATP